MSNHIKIMPEQVIERANEFKSCEKQHEELTNKMTNLVLMLSDVWESEAQEIFVSRYNDMKPSFDKFYVSLNELAEKMNKIANDMRNADNSLASRLGRGSSIGGGYGSFGGGGSDGGR